MSDAPMTAAPLALELSGLTKVFGSGATEVDAVTNVSFAVQQGEIVLVMGPSGSGKTTLLTLIAGLLTPTSGTVKVLGRDINALAEPDRSELRRGSIGFVFQSFNLLASLTAIQNVEVPMNLRGVRGRSAHERAAALLTRVGLAERLHFFPETLSGGERQRVSIARALANDPPLILADEPTANLDSRNGREVVTLLGNLARDDNRTVLIVSHDARIREVADRILWLEDGKVQRSAVRTEASRRRRDGSGAAAPPPDEPT